jgi:type IV pilus assembly protein PilX
MNGMNRRTSCSRGQRGAALIVGLLLLTVITLLAIAGMNSASVELIMAGNTQYQQKAFQASEMGVEQALVTGDFIPGAADVTKPDVAVSGAAPDTYHTTLHSDLKGAPQPAMWGNDLNAFSSYHFLITSVGTSARSAQATHLQGVAVLAPYSPTFTPDANAGGTTALK